MGFLKSEKGFAMPLVLIVLIVLTLLGIALWNYSMSELNHSVREEKRARAYYIARAGAESVARDLINDPSPLTEIPEIGDQMISNSNDEEFVEFVSDGNKVGGIKVEMKRITAESVEITGTGEVDGVMQSVSILLETMEQFDGVVYSLGSLDFQSGVTLNGDVVSGGKVKLPNNFNGTLKEDTVITFPVHEFTKIPEYEGVLTVAKDDNLIIPDDIENSNNNNINNGENNDDENGDNNDIANVIYVGPYQKIYIGHSATLVLDAKGGPLTVETKILEMHNNAKMLELKTVKGNDLTLIVDELDLKKLKVTGNGKAYIYVRSMMNVQTPHADVDDQALLIVRLDKGCIMEMQANSNFEGLVYGPEAVVEIAGNADFYGAMIVEQLKGSGGSFTIGSAGTIIDRGKYSWDFLGLDYGGYWMVHWLR